MKKLILILILCIPSLTFSQMYEGTARVAMLTDDYASIVFGSRGNSPSTFIVKISELDSMKAPLEQGKKYYFILKRVALKGTKKTAEVHYHDKATQQIIIELNDARYEIKEKIIGL